MIWVFKNKYDLYLLVGAQSEEEALNIIKVHGWESVHGELHTELKLIQGFSGLVVKDFNNNK